MLRKTIFGGSRFHKRAIFNVLQMMLVPFMGFMALGIDGADGGGNTEGEDKLLKKMQDETKAQIDKLRIDIIAQYKADATKGASDEANKLITAFKEDQPELKDNEEFIALKQMVEAIKTMQANNDKPKSVGLFGAIKSAMNDETVKGKIENLASKDRVEFVVKGDMLSGTVPNFPAIPMSDNMRTNEPVIVRGAGMNIVNDFPTVDAGVDYITETYEASKTGAPAYIAEGADAINLDYTFANSPFECKRVSVHTVISMKMKRSFGYIANKIQKLVERDLFSMIAGKMLTADGTGEDYKGLTSLGVAFSAATSGLEGRVGVLLSSDIIKILMAVESQAANGEFSIDRHYLNPTDVYLARITALEATAEVTEAAAIAAILSKTVVSTKVTSGSFISLERAVVDNYIAAGLRVKMITDDTENAKADTITVVTDITHTPVVNPNNASGIIFGTFAAAANDLNV